MKKVLAFTLVATVTLLVNTSECKSSSCCSNQSSCNIDNKIKSLTKQVNDVQLKLSKVLHEKDESKIKIDTNTAKLTELETDIVYEFDSLFLL